MTMPQDPGRDVAELVRIHRDALDDVKARLASIPLCDLEESGITLDDVFLLRYILSAKGDLTQATELIQKGVEYRKNNSGWILAAKKPDGVAPHSELLQNHLVGAAHKACNDESPVYIVRSGHTSASELWSSGATIEQVTEWATFRKEALFWRCDEITRRTGRLTKVLYVIDMQHSNIVQDIRGGRAFGASTKLSDFLHPQLIDRTVIMHPPATFRLLFMFGKRFASAKSIEKICVCRGVRNRGKDISSCPFVADRLAIEDVPSFLGGTCRCVDGRCICGIPNDARNRSDRSGQL